MHTAKPRKLPRLLAQILAALCQNPFVQNFTTGTIYKGSAKVVCAPGLNCYSCPAAALSCPLGALQSVAGSARYGVSFYALGILVVIGMLCGRLVCGWLCLFGLIQDALYKIPTPKLTVPERIDKPLRYLKYVVLVVFVIALPLLATNQFGLSEPAFCKYLCPAGTVEAGFPLLAANESLRNMTAGLFTWKTALALAILLASVFVSRPFCKYLCPLGAIYGLFNRISFLRLHVDDQSCTRCGACKRACPMQVNVLKNANSVECIRCGECRHVCSEQAISWSLSTKTNDDEGRSIISRESLLR